MDKVTGKPGKYTSKTIIASKFYH